MASKKGADLILVNGKVVTVDGRFSICQAIAVKNGWIIAVGADNEVRNLSDGKTEVVDLKGKVVLPGGNDSHMHGVLYGGTRPPLSLDLTFPKVKSIKDMAEELRKAVPGYRPGDWIRGFGWYQGFLEECEKDPDKLPRKYDFDAVSRDNPILFTDFSIHTLVVNSKALEIAGITKNTPDPSDGVMERDPATGDPTGVFKELAAQAMILKSVPLLTLDEIRQAALAGMKELNKNGITSFTDGALGPGGDQYLGGLLGTRCIDAYKQLYEEGKLTARVTIGLLMGRYGALSYNDLKTGLDSFVVPQGLDPMWLQMPMVKIFADGIPLTKTSWMWDEYLGGGYGTLSVPGNSDEERYGELIRLIGLVHERGFQVGVHAIGDRATDAAVDGFIKAMQDNPRGDPRHYLIHGDFITPSCGRRMAHHRIGVSMQPTIGVQIADINELIVGVERTAYEWPTRTMLDAGVMLTGSSDAPVTYPNWRLSLQSAVLREAWGSGKPSGPEESITIEETLRMYTTNGAWQDRMESIKGSIEVGKVADLQVLGADILTVDPHGIGDIPVVMTLVGGKMVYEAD